MTTIPPATPPAPSPLPVTSTAVPIPVVVVPAVPAANQTSPAAMNKTKPDTTDHSKDLPSPSISFIESQIKEKATKVTSHHPDGTPTNPPFPKALDGRYYPNRFILHPDESDMLLSDGDAIFKAASDGKYFVVSKEQHDSGMAHETLNFPEPANLIEVVGGVDDEEGN